jgi:hypothetical protein
MGFTQVLGNGFQRRKFPFIWVHKLSQYQLPASATLEVKVILQPSRPVCLHVRHLCVSCDQLFLININFRQLRVLWCRAPTLTRGRVYSLQMLLRLTNAVFLGSESHQTHYQIWESHNLEVQVPVFISPRNGVVQLYTQALCCNSSKLILWPTVSRSDCLDPMTRF